MSLVSNPPPTHTVTVTLWAPSHLSDTEVAEMVNDKLRTAGSTLVIDKVRAVREQPAGQVP